RETSWTGEHQLKAGIWTRCSIPLKRSQEEIGIFALVSAAQIKHIGAGGKVWHWAFLQGGVHGLKRFHAPASDYTLSPYRRPVKPGRQHRLSFRMEKDSPRLVEDGFYRRKVRKSLVVKHRQQHRAFPSPLYPQQGGPIKIGGKHNRLVAIPLAFE